MADERGPLTGVRIVEMTGIGPVPYAAMLMADFRCFHWGRSTLHFPTKHFLKALISLFFRSVISWLGTPGLMWRRWPGKIGRSFRAPSH